MLLQGNEQRILKIGPQFFESKQSGDYLKERKGMYLKTALKKWWIYL